MTAAPTIEARREAEFKKYRKAYKNPQYHMGLPRQAAWVGWLYEQKSLYGYDSVLDVACGRGESLGIAAKLGFTTVHGMEVVPELCQHPLVGRIEGIHKLPAQDNSYDIVSCQDAFEHILEEDVVPGIRELCRVARHKVFTSVAWFDCQCGKSMDMELHITRHELPWWMERFTEAVPDGASIREVTWLQKYDQTAILEISL